MYIFFRIYFAQHADAQINLPKIAMVLCEMLLISIIFLSTFMSFWSWLKEMFKKAKISKKSA